VPEEPIPKVRYFEIQVQRRPDSHILPVKYPIGPMSVVYFPRGTAHRTQSPGEMRLKLIVIKVPPE